MSVINSGSVGTFLSNKTVCCTKKQWTCICGVRQRVSSAIIIVVLPWANKWWWWWYGTLLPPNNKKLRYR